MNLSYIILINSYCMSLEIFLRVKSIHLIQNDEITESMATAETAKII